MNKITVLIIVIGMLFITLGGLIGVAGGGIAQGFMDKQSTNTVVIVYPDQDPKQVQLGAATTDTINELVPDEVATEIDKLNTAIQEQQEDAPDCYVEMMPAADENTPSEVTRWACLYEDGTEMGTTPYTVLKELADRAMGAIEEIQTQTQEGRDISQNLILTASTIVGWLCSGNTFCANQTLTMMSATHGGCINPPSSYVLDNLGNYNFDNITSYMKANTAVGCWRSEVWDTPSCGPSSDFAIPGKSLANPPSVLNNAGSCAKMKP